jgi:hypothetical protein
MYTCEKNFLTAERTHNPPAAPVYVQITTYVHPLTSRREKVSCVLRNPQRKGGAAFDYMYTSVKKFPHGAGTYRPKEGHGGSRRSGAKKCPDSAPRGTCHPTEGCLYRGVSTPGSRRRGNPPAEGGADEVFELDDRQRASRRAFLRATGKKGLSGRPPRRSPIGNGTESVPYRRAGVAAAFGNGAEAVPVLGSCGSNLRASR